MQISFLKILPENALKFVSKKMRICVKNFAQLQVFLYFHSNFPFHKIDKFLWDDRISLVKCKT